MDCSRSQSLETCDLFLVSDSGKTEKLLLTASGRELFIVSWYKFELVDILVFVVLFLVGTKSLYIKDIFFCTSLTF